MKSISSAVSATRTSMLRRAVRAVTLACLLACFGGVSVALAASVNNPGWRVQSGRLGAGATRTLTGGGNGGQTFSYGGLSLTCASESSASGKLTGSALPAPGTGEVTLTFKSCHESSSPECQINKKLGGEFTTKPLAVREVYLTKAAAEAESLAPGATATLLTPTAPHKLIAEFEAGSQCNPAGLNTIEGKGILLANTSANELLVSRLVEGPKTSPKVYFENVSGKTVETAAIGFEMDAFKATYQGVWTLQLNPSETWALEV